jgi:hypothetical protein
VINFKDPKDQLPSALAVVGMVGLAVSGVNLFFNKPFSSTELKKKTRDQMAELKTRIEKANLDTDTEKSKLNLQLWEQKVDSVTPVALAKLTTLAEENKVTLVSFRPQKPNEGTVLLQQPYVLTVDGPFSSVANLVDAIEQSGAKLAVSQVQMAASEGESDVVSAQIGLVAYLEKPKEVNNKLTKTLSPTPRPTDPPNKAEAGKAEIGKTEISKPTPDKEVPARG